MNYTAYAEASIPPAGERLGSHIAALVACQSADEYGYAAAVAGLRADARLLNLSSERLMQTEYAMAFLREAHASVAAQQIQDVKFTPR